MRTLQSQELKDTKCDELWLVGASDCLWARPLSLRLCTLRIGAFWRSRTTMTRSRGEKVGGRRDDLGWCGCPVRLRRGLCRGMHTLVHCVKMQGERPPWGIRRDDDADRDKSKGGRYLQRPLMLGDGGGVGQEIECCCWLPASGCGRPEQALQVPQAGFLQASDLPLAQAKHGFRLGAPLCGGMNPLLVFCDDALAQDRVRACGLGSM